MSRQTYYVEVWYGNYGFNFNGTKDIVFQSTTTQPFPKGDLGLIDVDGDGDLDYIAPEGLVPNLVVRTNNGRGGTWSGPRTVWSATTGLASLATGFQCNGEYASLLTGNNTVHFVNGSVGGVRRNLQFSDARLTDYAAAACTSSGIAACAYQAGSLQTTGACFLSARPSGLGSIFTNQTNFQSLSASDYDGDGDDDLLVIRGATASNFVGLSLLINDDTDLAAPSPNSFFKLGMPGTTTSCTAIDGAMMLEATGDSLPEILVSCSGQSSILGCVKPPYFAIRRIS
jgi:hypothetical protein